MQTMKNLRYEGFGPDKIAVIVETLTDNKNRTASNIRTIFQKNGKFEHKDLLLIILISLELLKFLRAGD